MKKSNKTWAILASFLLAMAMPSLAQAKKATKKFSSEEIGAQKTCRKDDSAVPVHKCMKKFAKEFCVSKGYKDSKAVQWSSSGDGYSDPVEIYCHD